MNDLSKRQEEFVSERNVQHDIDSINNRFLSPFQGMTEMYALQKGVEHGWEIGFAAFRESPEYLAMKAALERIERFNPSYEYTFEIARVIASEVLAQIGGET